MSRKAYPSDLTDAQWTLMASHIPLARPGGRPRRWPERELVNAIRYVLRGLSVAVPARGLPTLGDDLRLFP